MPRSRSAEVQAHLDAAGLTPFIVESSTPFDGKVAGRLRLLAIPTLRRDPRFQEGIWHLLHPNVGKPKTEFRANRGELIEGSENSLQVVINLKSGAFEADLDKYNTQDVVNIVGHLFGEVLPGWVRKVFRRGK
jgi:hypothetical protein